MFALPVAGATAAYAEATPPPPAECSDPGFTCNYDGSQWNVDAPPSSVDPLTDPTDNGPSPGGMFALFAIVVVVIGGGTFWWRVSTARRIAEQAGMDPDTAVSTAMLSNDGLAATYLAANLRQRAADDDAPVVHPPPLSTNSTERRLTELKRLHDQALITDDEYARRRTAIVDSL